MTLKKFLEYVSKYNIFNIYYDGYYVANIKNGEIQTGNQVDYSCYRIESIYYSPERACIDIKKPKRSTNNKAYKKWMRKYVKDHMDEIGLKDGGYAGDSAEDDDYPKGCANCKHVIGSRHEEPCCICNRNEIQLDMWERG